MSITPSRHNESSTSTPSRRALAPLCAALAIIACTNAAAADEPAAAPSYQFKTININPSDETVLLTITRPNTLLALDLTLSTDTCLLIQGRTKTPIIDPAGTNTACQGINSSGTIVGYYVNAENIAVGFVYANGVYADFVPPNGMTGLLPIAINDNGAIAGYYYDDQLGSHGFVLDGTAFTTFQLPGITNLFPIGLNNRGTMTIQAFDAGGALHAYLRKGTRVIELAVPGAVETVIERINNKGQAVGAYYDANGVLHGFVYDSTKAVYYTIDMPGAATTGFDGIDDAETLVGDFRATPGGLRQGLKAVGSLP